METLGIKISNSTFLIKYKENIISFICLVCVFLFVYTAFSKFIEHDKFLSGLLVVEFLKNKVVFISWAVPIAEIITSILLIIPKTYKLGLYIFLSLMLLFTGYIISMLLWAKVLPCSCGGVIEKLSWKQHVWFNTGFIAIAVFAILLSKLKFKNYENEKL